jgi:MFS family permease
VQTKLSTQNSGKQPSALGLILTGVLIVVVVMVFARLAFGLILPGMREGLELSYRQAGSLGTAMALGYLSLVLYAGILAAKRGGRFTVLLGIAFATAGFIGLSLVDSYIPALMLMALLGFGTAFGFTPLISLVSAWFPDKRGQVIGFMVSGVGFGMLLAGYLVPLIVGFFEDGGWRQVWLFFAAGGTVAFLMALRLLRNPPQPDSEPDEPVDRRSVYRNPHVITVGLLYGIIGLIYMIQFVFMYSFALDSGLSPTEAGDLTSIMGALAALSGPLWGWLGDRYGRALTLLISSTSALVGFAAPAISPDYTGFLAHYLIIGLTMNGMFISILAISSERVSLRQAPVAVSFITVFFASGQLIGPVVAGIIIESSGFRLAFAVGCVFLLAGVYFSIRLMRFPAQKNNHDQTRQTAGQS